MSASDTQLTAPAPLPAATILGYPRIGPDRELKRAVESYWKGAATAADLREATASLRQATRARLVALGLDAASAVPADSTLYDQVLDVTAALGAVPARFRDLCDEHGGLDLDGYFTLARGEGDRPALEMTKWLDSNYHYLVPEIDQDTPISYVGSAAAGTASPADQVRDAVAAGTLPRPVVVGPVTYLLLAKPSDDAAPGFTPLDRLGDVIDAYGHLLMDLHEAGAQWVQLDEPALASDSWAVGRARVLEAVRDAYTWLGAVVERPRLLVAGSYGSLGDALPVLGATPVDAVGLDLVAGGLPHDQDLAALAGKSVAAGVVSGRNIWRTDLDAALTALERLRDALPPGTPVTVTTSTSLLHVPHDVERETALDPQVRSWLAFADQKVGEVQVLARGLAQGREAVAAELAEDARLRAERAAHPGVSRPEVRQAVAAVTEADRTRAPYAERQVAQQARLGLPVLPTTTIGSFPQTSQIRRARAAYRRGELDQAAYEEAMRAEIASVVRLQEEIGLDVLVHGEAERNDMVQYFAELLDGFATTEHGWVQSYGSRCTRPSVLWGDVVRPAPMTVAWSSYAQSLTDRPLKGMLTGPVTIMAWSFVRDDVPRAQVADQLGLALRAEVADLEAAGIGVVQVDEPAIRETLPLRRADREEYLAWSVGSFRLATGGAAPATQVHTHLCYSEFDVVIDAVDHLDADVTSIEASRSRMDILPAVAEHGFERQLGPGVWDIHSPRVPSTQECVELLERAVAALGAQRLWANPDCGLKTRGYEEVQASLRNLVQAAAQVRAAEQAKDF
ncbi:5-methyltetrahydropteroyltriglutamate--homocysteine S-methyltransferase [Actinomyces lilanjuaniae]|uniref:5-methyltetrahydropteroyltriglutamate--homocysteine methyltransferase n=1 Tax=Actinomyces lilanjuaniae TaxID=2321394 RepID=A0ABM6Z6D5_9ACTO|nr:5-methyltetrahydropteroyltriglutamate--homocysteine S-methyltransferase [Actinomyces lilanjuaniae]AYD90724.1 5-methyltetrahydropteroyltriglutamate--homocysteine S-methyltransferase [Actinomyces lilanjuaniae]